jgi:hypothetical protein
LPATLDEPGRQILRDRLAAVLAQDGVRDCVCTVTAHGGFAQVELWVDGPVRSGLSAA